MDDRSAASNPNPADRRHHAEASDLISRFLQGELDAPAFARLQQTLENDAAVRKDFIYRALLEADLPDLLSTGSIEDMVDVLSAGRDDNFSEQNRPHKPARTPVRWKTLRQISLLLLFLGAGLGLWRFRSLGLRSALPAEKSLAVITRLYDVPQQPQQSSLVVGQQLNAGIVRLDAGTAGIVFQNGVKVLLQGPAELELVDAMHAYLRNGRAVFNVPPAAIGFVCETTEASVIDLGTEFGVSAGGPLGTAVQVYAGEVIANAIANEDSLHRGRRVQSGQAVRIVKGEQAVPEELQFLPHRFVRFLPDPNDGDDPQKTETGIYNKARHQELHIVPAPAGLEIDGELNDWDLSGQFASRCESPFDSYYHVRGAAMYDSEYLYISAEVGDPFPMRSKVSPHIQRSLYGHGGCLAFRISTDRQMGWPVRGRSVNDDEVGLRELVPEDLNDRLAFLVLWYYEPEKLPCLHVKYGMDEHDRKVNPPGYRGAFRKHTDGLGYTAEYAIPWSLLHAGDDPPQGGDTLGLTWLVHWSGPEGQNWRGQLIDIVNPAVSGWNYNQAGTWGRAIYDRKLGGE